MTWTKLPCVLLALACGPGVAAAQAPAVHSPADLPARLNEALPCVGAAADYHGVNPWVLRAILKVESDFDAAAVHRNANGTWDVGMAQINSIHFRELARWGVDPANLMDGCVASYVAAWHLARQVRAHGNSWFAIASYHSSSPCHNARYAGLLWNVLAGWGVVAGPRVKVAAARQCSLAAGTAGEGAARRGVREPTGGAAPALAFDEAR